MIRIGFTIHLTLQKKIEKKEFLAKFNFDMIQLNCNGVFQRQRSFMDAVDRLCSLRISFMLRRLFYISHHLKGDRN